MGDLVDPRAGMDAVARRKIPFPAPNLVTMLPELTRLRGMSRIRQKSCDDFV